MHRRQTLSHNLRAIADLRKRRQSGIECGGLVAETGFDSTLTLTLTATATATPRDFERELSDLIGASSGSAASSGGGGGDPTATTSTPTTTSTTSTATTSTAGVTNTTTSTNAKKNLDALAFATAQSRRAKDIIVEHFGFAPQNLVDEAINIVNALLMQALEACEAFLLEQLDDDDVVGGGGCRSDTVNNACLDDAAIEEGITSLTTLMENTVDKVFDRFDVFCKDKLMGIPPNTKVVLDRYKEIEDLKKELEEEEGTEHLSVEALELEVMELSKKVAAASYFANTVDTSLATLESNNASLKALLTSLQSITAPSGSTYNPTPYEKQLADLEAAVSEMEEDGHVAAASLQDAVEKRGGAIPYSTDGGASSVMDAVLLSYLGRTNANASVAAAAAAAFEKREGGDVKDVKRFLGGVQGGVGVMSCDEMDVAREVGGVPETLSRVKWGVANEEDVVMGQSSGVGFFGGVIAKSGDDVMVVD
ncbi:hypothetical protein HDU79_011596 [Rhizoclosmatium sp. JEL0117]|nr:hypothetical protein HDU79_011596 [Rhizoclosmatium sp. JEL0117]